MKSMKEVSLMEFLIYDISKDPSHHNNEEILQKNPQNEEKIYTTNFSEEYNIPLRKLTSEELVFKKDYEKLLNGKVNDVII